MYHVFLNVGAHLFGVSPSRKQDVSEAVFGFGLTDNDILSKGVVFPLFVRGVDGHRSHFTYLGNYAAVELHPVAWERLSEEVRFFVSMGGVSEPIFDWCSTRQRIVQYKSFGLRIYQLGAASARSRREWNTN